MRTAIALAIVAGALVAMIALLLRDTTQLWQLVAVGAFAGSLAGGVRWGRRGAFIGLATGCLLGWAAPFLYMPFWLVFTLPPHPEVDL